MGGGNVRIYIKGINFNTRNWDDSVQDRDYLRTLLDPALNLRS